MHFNLWRSLRDPHGRVVVEVALLHPAALDSDFLSHQVAQSVDHRALRLIHRVARVDDLAANVGGNPNLADLQPILLVNVYLRHFGKISQMACLLYTSDAADE